MRLNKLNEMGRNCGVGKDIKKKWYTIQRIKTTTFFHLFGINSSSIR